MRLPAILLAASAVSALPQAVPAPPAPEPISVVELSLPPAIAGNAVGDCTTTANPHRTGCIGKVSPEFQAGDFTPDGKHVVVSVEFVGAPVAPDPAAIYTGEQLIIVKTDGSKFSNGDPWKCLSCGVPAANAVSLDPQKDYPHAFRSGTKVLWGHNILDCGGALVTSDLCTPNKTYIYPLHWTTAADGSGFGGSPRELRLHPDDKHMGWSSFTNTGGQFCYFGLLQFNGAPTSGLPLAPRYDLVHVNLLIKPGDEAHIQVNNNNELTINDAYIGVGELRGFSGTGDEIIYIGPTWEANNIDLFAVHVVTGVVRRLTSHPEYADPIAASADNHWFVTMDTRGSDRQMFMSGMRAIPPLIDLVTVTVASSTRNNGPRRFFQPILIDRFGDRGNYYGQQINADGDGSNGSVNDPNWNGRADPAFSLDGTRIVYWQALVTSPSCGGVNPLVCPVSTAQGGRNYRLMLATLTSRGPKARAPVFKIPDVIPWATPFPPGAPVPTQSHLQAGQYTLKGKASGLAKVTLIAAPSSTQLRTVAVTYTNYSDDKKHVINGYENVTVVTTPPLVWKNQVDWYSDIIQTGIVSATKKTSPDGFHLDIDATLNIFQANGTLTTTINGVAYHQPANNT